jgi:hypothetical protein
MAGVVRADEPRDLPITPVGPSAPTDAPDAAKKVDPRAPVVNKPVYNPETKSYFELFRPDQRAVDLAGASTVRPDLVDINWEDARLIAASRLFRGVRGRLAVVKTEQTNQFIIKSLRPAAGNAAWIGLRFMCSGRTLQWIDGELWPLTAYANWAPIWNRPTGSPEGRTRIECGPFAYLPVHYWGADGGFKWNANGPAKRFYHLIIEYPTGKP